MKIFTIKNIVRYTYRLGLFHGFYVLLKLTKSKGKINLKVNGNPIELRAGTSDVMVFDQIFVSKEYEYDYGTNDARTIIDCGGNIGLSAIFFATKFPNAQMLVLEPMAETYEVLAQNVKPYKNIKVINGAIWNKETVLSGSNAFGDEPWTFSVTDTQAKKDDVAINAYSIDSLMGMMNTNTVDILKIDIEGGELELFSNNYESWLPKINCIAIELHDRMRKGTGTSFFRAVSKYEFSYFYYKEKVICIKN